MTVLIWEPSLLETSDKAPLPGLTVDETTHRPRAGHSAWPLPASSADSTARGGHERDWRASQPRHAPVR